jgi:hypothetical protein
MRSAAVKSFLAILTVLVGSSLAPGQAGSVGGVVGKTDKEMSGAPTSPESTRRVPGLPPRTTEGGRLTVTSATLGANCGAPRGNVTSQVAEICNGRDICQLPGSRVNKRDPAVGCPKTFAAEWNCSAGGKPRSAAVPRTVLETNVLTLSCN